MSGPATVLAGRLAREAEAVCRHYLSNGRRAGRYWQVGDVFNAPGRSLYVRLIGPTRGKGAAGHWTDAATGEHGDLLDLIARNCDCRSLSETLAEARRFLGLPRQAHPRGPQPLAPRGSAEAARRLFAAAQPLAGTLAEAYLRGRGITARLAPGPLRYHPACWCRLAADRPPEPWPALLAAVTDGTGRLTGLQRTWLARDGAAKAPLPEPRRAMGELLGHGVRFGASGAILAASEGIETMLSLRSALPDLPCVAALSAAHLAALRLPDGLRCLYIARDADPAGHRAAERLAARAVAAGIAVVRLDPMGGDFNDDLRRFGLTELRGRLMAQLAPEDAGIGSRAFVALQRSDADSRDLIRAEG